MCNTLRCKTSRVAILIIFSVFNVYLIIRLINIEKCNSQINVVSMPEIISVTSQNCPTSLEYNTNNNNNNNRKSNKMIDALINNNNNNNNNNFDINDNNIDDNFNNNNNNFISPAFINIDFNVARWDNRRYYKYYDFAIIGEEYSKLSKEYSVCLATQSSIERLYPFVQVARYWTGPLSLAIFIAGDDEFDILQLYVTFLRHCFPFIRKNVSFHLAVSIDKPPRRQKFHMKNWENYNCASPELTLKELLKMRTTDTIKWRLKNPYPQNNMRNLARKGCQSDYVFLTDIDIVPSLNITNQLDEFLRTSKCGKLCAYVVPTYEVDVRTKFPHNKQELIRLVRKGLARPFHERVFIHNQYATNFSRWEKDLMMNKTHIAHKVTNFEFLYEPFYVALDEAPAHDERFLGYGFTRNTQVYEMYVAGYQFHVLSPVFTYHWGLQNKKGRPAWRERQNDINRKRFDSFKKEILIHHGKDKRSFEPNTNRVLSNNNNNNKNNNINNHNNNKMKETKNKNSNSLQ